MIAKISSLLAAALVTATAGMAAAHDGDGCQQEHGSAARPAPAPAVYTPVGYPDDGYRDYPAEYRRPGGTPGAYRARANAERHDLRRSDLNRDGLVTLAEALQEGRREFVGDDHDRNRVLTRREVAWGEFAQDDRDRNGVISYGEHQDAVRRSFRHFDVNRDGVLARYELRQPGSRAVGWQR